MTKPDETSKPASKSPMAARKPTDKDLREATLATLSQYSVADNLADGEAFQINGPVLGDVHVPDRAKVDQCLLDLKITDPRVDKRRIEIDNDGLIRECYSWVLKDPVYTKWEQDDDTPLLWISGDPGIGKTMMAVGIIDRLMELPKSPTDPILISYFFCQNAYPTPNNAASILRGIIYLLICEQPSLDCHIRARYRTGGPLLFEGPSAVHSLWDILSDMLDDLDSAKVFLVVDAMDECEQGLDELLRYINQKRPKSSNTIKWLITGRRNSHIEHKLSWFKELNLSGRSDHISKAVDEYIRIKLKKLVEAKKYDNELQQSIKQHLRQNAGCTFLWVSLVCRELQNVPDWKRPSLEEVPPGLEQLYQAMILRMQSLGEELEICKKIISTVIHAYRPLHLGELVTTAGITGARNEPQSLSGLVHRCGSFLTVREDTIYFVHQSAKQFLVTEGKETIFHNGEEGNHLALLDRLLQCMELSLGHDICKIRIPGGLLGDNQDYSRWELIHLRYACCHWARHLVLVKNLKEYISDSGCVYVFLQKHFLHWLEALSLMRRISDAFVSLDILRSVVNATESPRFSSFIDNATRFITLYGAIIAKAPLQTYGSALVFSPSEIRREFIKQAFPWITRFPVVESSWNPTLRVLEVHPPAAPGSVNDVSFSPDDQYIASASSDGTVRLWDTRTGILQTEFRGHTKAVNSITFSSDGDCIASASNDKTVIIWNKRTQGLVGRLVGHQDAVLCVRYSGKQSTKMATASSDHTIRIWNAESQSVVIVIEQHTAPVNSVAFSPDGVVLASGSDDLSIMFYNLDRCEAVGEIKDHTGGVNSVSFSPDGKILASASKDKSVRLWNVETRELRKLARHHESVNRVEFCPTGYLFASAASDHTLRVWEVQTGAPRKILTDHQGWVLSTAFSSDSQKIASSSVDGTIRLWDAKPKASEIFHDGHASWINTIQFSPDGKLLASASSDKSIVLWDVETGSNKLKFEEQGDAVDTMLFSPDGRTIASKSSSNDVLLWDVSMGCRRAKLGHSAWVNAVVFSLDGHVLATASDDKLVKIWDVKTGNLKHSLTGHTGRVNAIAFSDDNQYVASASSDATVRIWNVIDGTLKIELRGHTGWVLSVAITTQGDFVASGSTDGSVIIWHTPTGSIFQRTAQILGWINAVSFSPDSWIVASASDDKMVRFWDVNSGRLLKEQNIDSVVKRLTFTPDGNRIVTDRGVLSVGEQIESAFSDRAKSQKGAIEHASLYAGTEWITCRDRGILWLPPDYRATAVATWGKIVAMGHASGRITILAFETESIPFLEQPKVY